MSRPRVILHPSDFSPASRPALAEAIAVAKQQRAQLLIVHVLATVIPMISEGYMPARTYDELARAGRADAERRLDALVARAKKAGVRATGLVLEGTAAQQIVRAAQNHRAALIVMGTHGRTGLAKLLVGSVAERVVGSAPCPVMTVRGKR